MEKAVADISPQTQDMGSASEYPSVNSVSLSLESLGLDKDVTIDDHSLTAKSQHQVDQGRGTLPTQPEADLLLGSTMQPIIPSWNQHCLPNRNVWTTGHNLTSNVQLPGASSSFSPPGFTRVNGTYNITDNPYSSAVRPTPILGRHEFLNTLAFFYAGILNDITFIKVASSEAGSMELQNLLLFRNPEVTRQLFGKVISSVEGVPIIVCLMMDAHGKYVFLKLIDSCNSQQLKLISEKITEDQLLFLKLTLDEHGSKSIQKLIRILKNSPLISPVVFSLSNAFYSVMTDRTGSYVVSECLAHLNYKQKASLYEAAIRHCIELATNERGCLSLNNLIDNIQGPHRYYLLDKISTNAVYLSQDPFGNYVVQKILGLENPTFTSKLCYLLRGHYLTLSLQKGGSHVVEKCLNSLEPDFVVKCLLDGCSSANQLLRVARDRYGNYVIQAALKITKQARSALYPRLLKSLQPHLDDLRFGHGKNVFNLVVEGLASTNPNNVSSETVTV